MSEAARFEEAALPLSQARRVDAVCFRFETAWKAGQRPRLEDYLGDTSEPERSVLLRELIALEIDYRRRAGEQPQGEEYRAYLPSLDSAQLAELHKTESPTLPSPAFRTTANTPEIPGYEILGELGRGGMGIVYRAWQTSLNRHVALKMVLAGAHASPQELARFRTEAEAVARLQHPHIVQIYEVGRQGLHPYMALEYVDGGNLAQKLVGTPLPARQAAQWVATLARAVHYAHQRGIVHRDLTPANVLLARSEPPQGLPLGGLESVGHAEHYVPKLTDFGLAKLLVGTGPTLTHSGAFLGTPSYVSPEQAAGRTKELGPACDIYALGAILYELLTGRPPFKAETHLETLAQVQSQEPVSPSRLRPKLPRDLTTICLKCLEKESGKRYASAEALADDLQRFLAGEPILARPVGSTERLWRWCGRNPAVASLMGFVAALLVLMAVGSMLAALRLREDRDRAERAERQAKEKLWQSYRDQARAGRLSRRVGQRLDSLQAVREAAHLARELNLTEPSILELRNLAIACLALTDLGVAKEWEGFPTGSMTASFDGGLERYVRLEGQGILSIRSMDDDQEIYSLPGIRGSGALLFSADRRFLAQEYGGWLKLWRLAGAEASLVLQDGKACPACGFSQDSRWFAIGRSNGFLDLIDLTSGQPNQRLKLGDEPRRLAFHPTDRQLAIAFRDAVRVYDLDTGNALAEFHLAQDDWPHLAWHPDGKTLGMVGGDRVIALWDVASHKQVGKLEGHRSGGIALTFDHAGDLLASTAWEDMLRLWDPRTGKQLFSTQANMTYPLRFSPDDRLLAGQLIGNKLRVLEVTGSREYRTLVRNPVLGKMGQADVTISPDGRLLAAGMEDGMVGFWDLSNGKELGPILSLTRGVHVLFEPSGALLTNGPVGLLRWPVQGDAASAGLLRIGPPQELHVPGSHLQIAQSRDGQVIARALGRGNGADVVHLERSPRQVRLSPHPDVRYVAVSPDGRWVATGSHGVSLEVKIWEAATGKPVTDLPVGNGTHVAFSPDGNWLATCGDSIRVWQVGSWQERLRLEGPPPRTPLAFSPDSNLLAFETGYGSIRLVDVDTGREHARLEDPDQDRAIGITFSPDGTQLVAPCDSGSFHIWDLRLIRTWLAANGLDWDLPPYPPVAQEKVGQPLALNFNYGNLIVLTNPRQAVGVYSLAIVLCPINPEVYVLRGRAYGRLNERQKAIADYSRFLALAAPDDKRHADVLFRRSNDYRALKQRASWLADLLQLVRLNLDGIRELHDDVAEGCNELAWQLVAGSEREHNPAKALPLAEKAVELRPGEWMYLNTLGVVYYRLDRYQEAIEKLEQSLRHSKGEMAAFDLFFLAMCHSRLGDATEAQECYQRAVRSVQEHQGKLHADKKKELDAFRIEAEVLLRQQVKP